MTGPNSRSVAVLRLLSNERRFAIVQELLGGELSVGDLAVRVGLSQSALSQHLARFRAAGAVKTRRDAQTIYYSCDDRDVRRIYEAARATEAE